MEKKKTKVKKKTTLTEDQIVERLKEIAKLDIPLEINKQLRELTKECDYSLQILGKQVNYIRKEYKKSVVTQVTEDTEVTDITEVTDKEFLASVTSVTCNSDLFEVIFGDSILEQIIKNICIEKKPLTFGELALKTKKSEAHIRNVISKNNTLFGTIKPNGKKSYTYLLQMVFSDLEKRIEQFKSSEEKKRLAEMVFKKEQLEEKEYLQEISNYLSKNKIKREGWFLILDFSEIVKYSSELADLFLDEPEKFFECIKSTYGDNFNIKIRNIPKLTTMNIEDLRKDHLGKIVCLESRVVSIGNIRPIITKAIFRCPGCETLLNIVQNYRIGILREPVRCSCGRRGGFETKELEKKDVSFIQLEDLQDKTDNHHGTRLKGILFNKLCESEIIKKFAPGNEVKVVGILKEVPTMKGNSQSVFFDQILEVMDVDLVEEEIEVESFDEETLKKIKEISKKVDQEGVKHLDNSFAPEVYGYEEIKRAIMLQLSNRKNEPKVKSVRNKSNILLIGDPGIAKTVIGKYAVKVSSGAREAVGGGSSAVGITASVIKEEDSMGGYRVEPGAMVLAKDLLFIDELNNLQDEDKPKLQEGLSEQRISINKANLHVQMKVTCGTLAVANPIHGHFRSDVKESLTEQFNIPSPILNRFDTIFMMQDRIDDDTDRKIAGRMMKRHKDKLEQEYPPELLKKYFAYIKVSDEPEIGDKEEELMKKIYSQARKEGGSGVKINPRFFESLTRMSSAAAKMRLSKLVEEKDIQEALAILAESQYKINELLLSKIKK